MIDFITLTAEVPSHKGGIVGSNKWSIFWIFCLTGVERRPTEPSRYEFSASAGLLTYEVSS